MWTLNVPEAGFSGGVPSAAQLAKFDPSMRLKILFVNR